MSNVSVKPRDRSTAPLRQHPTIDAADQFVATLAGLDRQARREGRTLPTDREREELHAAFWEALVPALRAAGPLHDTPLGRVAREDVQARLRPWLLRSRLWNRSWTQPHGYAGDFRIVEWMYDLEADPCADPTQPAVVNLLDGLFKSVHSVRAVWHRRHWFADLITEQIRHDGSPVQILDVACGGSRYVRDVMDTHGAGAVRPTFIDQDPTALAFVRAWLPALQLDEADLICTPVRRLGELLASTTEDGCGQFDIVISTGLFDYLPHLVARDLMAAMAGLARPGGVVAVCNFSPEDASRSVKDWIDWELTYRTEADLEAILPPAGAHAFSRSPDGGLVYARLETCHDPARRPRVDLDAYGDRRGR